MWRGVALLLLAALAVPGGAAAGPAESPPIRFVGLDAVGRDYDRVVDARPLARCRAVSLAGARCLPVEEVLAPNRRLANFSGLLWLLGSAGLTGSEHLLVIGDDAQRRDFVAGLLYLAGQKRVSVLNIRVSGRDGFNEGQGVPRSSIREQVFRAPMRDRRLVLRAELQRMIASDRPPVLLDGRSEAAYWGVQIHAARGGHLPGAQHLESDTVKRLAPGALALPAGRLVAYGGDAYTGLAFLARLVAVGVDAALYLEGWSGWASDGSLPVDSLSFARYAEE